MESPVKAIYKHRICTEGSFFMQKQLKFIHLFPVNRLVLSILTDNTHM